MICKAILSGALALALLTPAAALAQQSPPANNGSSGGVGVGAYGRMTEQQEGWRFESEEMRRRNSMTPEEAEAEYGPERVELANRVQALIDAGKCREARAMANDAGERLMALRIRQTCRAR
ncbi:hypothetical protein GGQ87_001341 [Brevundimonas alba]|uniref:DUF4148 domain-containing protein n=1 Tax=Brevundimonas alba TaxID=74314 RepID=A0A7X5YJT2_9CAUL|nr:hypothetical protein [Brevundimonas alba]NJC41083.1 hypothetical protein [Brevundimonas alba]